MSKERKKRKFGKVLLIILCVIIVIVLAIFVMNRIAAKNLISFTNSFEAVDYTNIARTLPEYDESIGHYVFAPDDDLKIMVMTDLHIGGGSWSKKSDTKTIYEVITMLQKEKPDLVILNGDNIFAVPGPVFNGGGTFNNKMASKVVLNIFEHEGVYFTTVFGNHDTESFDFFSREQIGKLYESDEYEYCIFQSEFSDTDNAMPSVSNQMIGVKNKAGDFSKVLMLIDTNDYVDNSIKASMDWKYDVIHDAQVDWAKEEIKTFKGADALAFFHIPFGEYQEAYVQLEKNNFKDTEDVKYIKGVWDEVFSEKLGVRVCFGGCSTYKDNPLEADSFFEELGPGGANVLDACFCGHDHVNNAVVSYKGVELAYMMSLDNLAYDGIAESGLQRGCNIINLHQDGSYDEYHKNAYLHEGVDANAYTNVYTDRYYYEDAAPAK